MKNQQSYILTSKIAQLISIAAVSSLAVAANADAALLFSSSDSFTNERTDLVGMPELTVTKYTPPAGVTVAQIQVVLNVSVTTEGTITNNTAQPKSFSIGSFVLQFDVIPESDSPPLTTLQPFPLGEVIGLQDYINIASGQSVPFGPFTLDGIANQNITNPGDIANLLGGGTISFAPFTQILLSQQGDVPPSFAFETFASATLTINYFDQENGGQVPEPSALLGLGLLSGLALLSKKKTF